ncbi:carboxylic ester hydrolase [Parastagonospora nodorum]|nr:carboxylic ester hydrolase [Parastagonospora nodorum]KAH5395231.1 carboxylic ester hydrolase [Parastagonospora nodorum]KAH6233065.1 carboxylic ester hydrolase [Parastagonospora nodorum]KAH6248543.1 carboxylic ester hydrolase [Parastagonospora nodorum]
MQLFETVNSFLAQFVLNSTTAFLTSSPQSTPLVNVKNGTLAGVHNAAFNQDFFFGIPFATPPVGKHRLQRPEPPQAWNGTRNADVHSPWCAGSSQLVGHLPGFTQSFDSVAPTSEDCLYLDIVRPATALPEQAPLPEQASLPVLVWIHGGGWVTGSGTDPRYNGSFLVQKSVKMETPIIYVSINYRLGTFGFLAGSAIEAAGLTNNGLRDQRQALLWIQENIAAFGGDPDRVTLFGESAGAASIGQQLIAFGGRDDNLFHGAIMQSGFAATAHPLADAPTRENAFQGILNATGCLTSQDSIACLQAVPTEILGLASPPRMILITTNDDFFPELPSKSLEDGHFLKVPIIAGINRNEGTALMAMIIAGLDMSLNTFEEFAALFAGRDFPAAAIRKLWDLYGDEIENPTEAGLGPISPSQAAPLGLEFSRTSLWHGDNLFTFPKRHTNQIWSGFGVPSYSYFFDITPDESFLDPAIYGVPHFAEIAYVFGNAEAVGWEKNPIPQESDKADAAEMMDLISRMWISFTVTGSPNNHKKADVKQRWPEYSNVDPTSAWFKLSGLTTQADTWRQEAMEIYLESAKGSEW